MFNTVTDQRDFKHEASFKEKMSKTMWW